MSPSRYVPTPASTATHDCFIQSSLHLLAIPVAIQHPHESPNVCVTTAARFVHPNLHLHIKLMPRATTGNHVPQPWETATHGFCQANILCFLYPKSEPFSPNSELFFATVSELQCCHQLLSLNREQLEDAGHAPRFTGTTTW